MDGDRLEHLNAEAGIAMNKWWIVLVHAPAYSAGKNHTSNTSFRNAIKSLKKRKPNLVISGHNHQYVHFRDDDNVDHVTSAGGGSHFASISIEEDIKKYKIYDQPNYYHYFSIAINGNILTFTGYGFPDPGEGKDAQIENIKLEDIKQFDAFEINYSIVLAEPVPTQFDRCVSNRFSSPLQAMQKTMPPSMTSYSAGDTIGGRKVLNFETGSKKW